MPANIWIETLDESELKEDAINLAFPEGVSILLIKRSGNIYAVRNRCAHMSCPLSGGWTGGYVLRCPCHEWSYDIRTGEVIGAREIRIPTYEWKSEAGKIYIKMEG